MSQVLLPTPQPSRKLRGSERSTSTNATACILGALLALAAPAAMSGTASAQVTSPGTPGGGPSGPSGSASAAPARATGLQLEMLSGMPARTERRLLEGNAFGHGGYAPWNAFVTDAGGSWRVLWDADTGVPLRIFGSGIAAPGASVDPIAAERAARALLDRHLGLLAPGASPADFVLGENVVTPYGLRVVSFLQHKDGVPVEGGAVAFDIRADRIALIASTAVPSLGSQQPRLAGPIARAEQQAESYIGQLWGGSPQAEGSALVVLPVLHGRGRISAHLAHRIRVRVPQPMGLWEVYLDAETAAPIARRALLMSFDGQVLYGASVRQPGGARMDYPASLANGTVNGSAQTTDEMGTFSWTSGGSTASIGIGVVGPDVRVINSAGSAATFSGSLVDGATATFGDGSDEYLDAQLNTYVHARRVRDYARTLNPGLAWLSGQLQATVNMDDVCNAFSDGDTINFFREGGGAETRCNNTGRLADVIYHEFGHSLHQQSIIRGRGNYDGAMGEGVGDFIAARLTGDPEMAPGFFLDGRTFRHIDPPGREDVYPDDLNPDIHISGLIYAGAMWDLRNLLIDNYGETEGLAILDRVFIGQLQLASDMPTSYVAALEADDDDGNLANGTPHYCEIDQAFRLHGLTAGASAVTRVLVSHDDDKLRVTAADPGGCDAATGATVTFRNRGEAGGTPAAMDEVAPGEYEADYPAVAPGTVIEYQVAVSRASGVLEELPLNAASRWYERYVGAVTVLYCTDFETDPAEDGWTHELVSGPMREGADDWEWGPAGGRHIGDPRVAHSGVGVYGNDLGVLMDYNGLHQPDVTNATDTPVIDTAGYGSVRLQYWRWLEVEDSQYDQARILADGETLWVNASEGARISQLHHRDQEWRFHDVDLSAQAADGSVQVRFQLSADGGLEFGGWTLDDVCIVAASGCGDGTLDAGEACDDGEANSDTEADACRLDCTLARCGDGVIDGGESCDDGAANGSGACSATCTVGICGDGVVDEGEACDDGEANSDTEANACRSTCVAAMCGDGVQDSGEQCDDGNAVDGDGCTSACMSEGGGGGCGCRVAGAESNGRGLFALVALLGLAIAIRRRR